MNAACEYAMRLSPSRYQILGVKLKPLSLRHYFLMAQMGLCFVDDQTVEASTEDLFLAVLICSKVWKDGEFEDFCETADWEQIGKSWGEQVGRQGDLSAFDLTSKIKLFLQYINESVRPVKYWVLKESSGGESGAHWSQSVLVTCTGELGYTRQEALDAPIGVLLADYMKHAESQGIIQLMTAEEIAQVEEMEASA